MTYNAAKDVSGADGWDCAVCAAGVVGMVAANNAAVSATIGPAIASSCGECISDLGNMICGNSDNSNSGNGGEGGAGGVTEYNSGGSITSSTNIMVPLDFITGSALLAHRPAM